MDVRIFKTMMYDTQRIDGKTTVPFFHDTADDEVSVTSNTEDQILRWILTHRSVGRFFIDHFATDLVNLRAYVGLTHPFVTPNQKPGDIDLFLVDPSMPQRGIAFEVKRVKALAIDDEVSKVNGAEKIVKGVIQANKYQSIGFGQSYLLLIVLNDGRAKATANVMLRSANSIDVRRVYNIPWNEPLHRDVGIVFFDVDQPTGRHINQTGSVGICIDKEAAQIEQSYEFTKRVIQLINSDQPYIKF